MLLIGQVALQRQYGLRWLTFVPSTLYGPGYHRDERQMHFIFDLIRKIVWAKSSGEAPVLWGDGYQRRELVYIDDFVSAATTLAPICTNEIVNIGSGEEYSIRDYARMICDIVGYDFNLIRFDTTRYVGAKSKVLRVEKLKALFPDFRKTPLLDGLQQTIDWFCASQQVPLSKSGLGS
jgi:GDP-L-fucose synthase